MVKIIAVLLTFIIVNSYIYFSLIAKFSEWKRAILIAIVVGFMCQQAITIFDFIIPYYSVDNSHLYTNITMPMISFGYLIFGGLSCLIALLLVSDLLLYFLQIIKINPMFVKSLKIWLGYICLTLTAVSMIIGRVNALNPKIYPVEITLDNLPKQFDGFTIVQISDIHLSASVKKEDLDRVVAMANAQHPDMIAITGDIVDGSVANLLPATLSLNNLNSTYGTFLITGNHEYYSGVTSWLAEFKKLKLNLLLNESKIIKIQDAQIAIGGVTDYSTITHNLPYLQTDVKATFKDIPKNMIKILLAHSPNTYKQAVPNGVNLMLSGHTHAGQYFPFNLVIGLFQRYYVGLSKNENTFIYVNKGTFFWGPPLRSWSRPEVTLITLKAGN